MNVLIIVPTYNARTSGYRCWRRQALRLDRIASQRCAVLVATVFEAARLGFTIGEVPIVVVERRQGASKMFGHVLFESMVMP